LAAGPPGLDELRVAYLMGTQLTAAQVVLFDEAKQKRANLDKSDFQPSLRDCSIFVCSTEDCVLGYCQPPYGLEKLVADWTRLKERNIKKSQALGLRLEGEGI
jgi:hypothetical protein